MSVCKGCRGRGYVESWHGGANSWTPSVQQCPKRCDVKAYSDEIQRRLSDPTHITGHLVLSAKPSESKSHLRVVK